MHPLSFLLSQSCPPPSLYQPKQSSSSCEVGSFNFPFKEAGLSWQALVQYPWCPPGGVPQGHGLQRLFPGNGAGQQNRSLDSSDGQQSSEVLHFQAKIISDVYFRLSLSLTIPLHRCQSSIVTCGLTSLSSLGLLSNNGFTLLVPSDMWFSEDWDVTVITMTYPKRQVGSDVWGKTHWVVGSRL